MRRWGRHGEIPWILDTLISLILIALCAYAMFAYIGTNAKGEGYFSRYHAADLSSIAEIAAAPQGDTTVRYDNLRDTLDLGFWFTNGKVAVGTPQRFAERVGLVGDRQDAMPASIDQPPGAAIGRYAPAERYRDSAFDKPRALAIGSNHGTLTVVDIAQASEACPQAPSTIARENAKAFFDLAGAATPTDREAAQAAFRDVLQAAHIQIAQNEADATIGARIALAVGSDSSLTAQPGDAVSVAIACDAAQQLRVLTLADIAFSLPSATGTGPSIADMTLTVSNEDRIAPAQIGRAAAYALLRRYP